MGPATPVAWSDPSGRWAVSAGKQPATRPASCTAPSAVEAPGTRSIADSPSRKRNDGTDGLSLFSLSAATPQPGRWRTAPGGLVAPRLADTHFAGPDHSYVIRGEVKAEAIQMTNSLNNDWLA